MDPSGQAISRAQAEQRMFDKPERPDFLADVKPLLTAEEAARFTDEAGREAFAAVFREMVQVVPGERWANTADRSNTSSPICSPPKCSLPKQSRDLRSQCGAAPQNLSAAGDRKRGLA